MTPERRDEIETARWSLDQSHWAHGAINELLIAYDDAQSALTAAVARAESAECVLPNAVSPRSPSAPMTEQRTRLEIMQAAIRKAADDWCESFGDRSRAHLERSQAIAAIEALIEHETAKFNPAHYTMRPPLDYLRSILTEHEQEGRTR